MHCITLIISLWNCLVVIFKLAEFSFVLENTWVEIGFIGSPLGVYNGYKKTSAGYQMIQINKQLKPLYLN
jgi:hypothetical protein